MTYRWADVKFNLSKTLRRTNLPLVTVEALGGRTIEQKRGLVKDITEAVIKNFNVKPEAVTVVIHELSRENLAKAGKLFTDS